MTGFVWVWMFDFLKSNFLQINNIKKPNKQDLCQGFYLAWGEKI